ncbi:MAG: ATP-binding cassette domain-containing protein [Cyanobacteria bacterium P01_C01_bin.89]
MTISPGTRLLLDIANKNRFWIASTIVISFFTGVFNGVSVALLVPVLLGFVGAQEGFGGAPGVVGEVLGLFSGIPEDQRLMVMLGIIIGAIVAKNFMQLVNTAVGGHLSRQLVNEATFRGLRLVLGVGIDFYSQVKTGDLIQRLGSESSGAVGTINTIVQISATTVTLLTFMGVLSSISWQLTLLAIAFGGVVVVANRWFSLTARALGRQAILLGRQYTSQLVETIGGIRLIKSTSNEPEEFERLTGTILQKQRVELRSQGFRSVVASVNELMVVVALVSIVVIGQWIFANQTEVYAAILLTYLFLLSRVLGMVTTLGKALNNLALCTAAVNALVSLLRTDNKHQVPNGSVPYRPLEDAIQFVDVSFHYPTQKKRKTLQKVNLTIAKGQTVALVGTSGAGKTTMTDLITRFYDPVKGKILLDGHDLRDLDLPSLHRAMGIVSQDTFLFNDTVRNNIAYAWSGATDQAVREAAQRANADEFINELPDKYETVLGDRGVRLSGGQQQRIAIARALLRDPDILILDEATSALDTVSERMVQEALTELSRGRTVLVIAHRLSTVQSADQIVVMEKGTIAEQGTHSELLALNGKYARLYTMQFSDSATPTAIHCENVLEQVVLQEAFAQMSRWRAIAGVSEPQSNGAKNGAALGKASKKKSKQSSEEERKEEKNNGHKNDAAPAGSDENALGKTDFNLIGTEKDLPPDELKAIARAVVRSVDVSSIMAYTLNQLPALYATSREGVKFQQQRIDQELRETIREQVAEAIEHHRANPDFEVERQKLATIGPVGKGVGGSVLERLSYEVRTHLNTLIGVLTLLSDDLADRKERQELLQEAYGASMQILTVSELLRETLKRRQLTLDGNGALTSMLSPGQRKTIVGENMRRVETVGRLVDKLTQGLERLTDQLLDDLLRRSPGISRRLMDNAMDTLVISPETPLFQEIYSDVTALLNQIEHLEKSTIEV